MWGILAWFATFLAFTAYIGVSIGYLNNKSRLFLYANFIASVIFVIHGVTILNYSAVAQNVFFSTFAFFGIVRWYINFNWFDIKLLLILMGAALLIPAFIFEIGSEVWFFETLGWPSVCAIVGAFVLYTQQKITTLLYFWLNVVGNIFLSIHLIYFDNYQFAALQIFALFMGLFGIFQIKTRFFKI